MKILRFMLSKIRDFLNTIAISSFAERAYKRTQPSVVYIRILDEDHDKIGGGSGFFVGDGRMIATNFHVIEDAFDIRIDTSNETFFQIRNACIDPENDIALLESPEVGKPLTLSMRTYKHGEDIVAIGNPQDLVGSTTKGIVSAIRNNAYQIDAAVSPGSSGGPIMDKQGNVIGVVRGSRTDGQNLNFAIQAQYVQALLDASTPATWLSQAPLWADLIKQKHEAIEQGDINAQAELGVIYNKGMIVPQDYAEAVKWFRRAAEQESAQAQCWLGMCYDFGEGVPQDDIKAVKWYRYAAEQGYAIAQLCLGLSYARGDGVARDDREAAKWYRCAAEQGLPYAQYELSTAYCFGKGVRQDYKQAYVWSSLAAVYGNERAASLQKHVGQKLSPAELDSAKREADQLYRKIQKLEQNATEHAEGQEKKFEYLPEDIQKLLDKAEAGDADAQCALGWNYDMGHGVPVDEVEAVKWFQRAAEQGHAKAQQELGLCYHHGKGVSEDMAEAVKWYRCASDSGDFLAPFFLGQMYADGEYFTQSDVRAAKWFHRAAELGWGDAQMELGHRYVKGLGVLESFKEAYIWFSLAAVNEWVKKEEASEHRDNCASSLSPADLAAAQDEAVRRHKKVLDATQ